MCSGSTAADFHERTEKLKVMFAAIKLIEADIRLDSNSRPRIAHIGITTRHDGKAFAFWLPRKVRNRICAPRQRK